MNNLALQTVLQIDKRTGAVGAVYFQLRKGRVAETEEVIEGTAFVDYDKKGQVLGVELLAPCKVTALDKIVRKEPPQVKRLLKGAIPRELAIH
jgi:uncharacterized protein YuzE